MSEQSSPTDRIVNSEEYESLLNSYIDQSVPFHPPGYEEETLELLARRPGMVFVDDIPFTVPVSEADVIIEPSRCFDVAQRSGLLTSAEQEVRVSLVPLPILLKQAAGVKDNHEPGSLIFVEYEVSDGELDLINECKEQGWEYSPLVHSEAKTEAAINFFEVRADRLNPSGLERSLSLLEVVDGEHISLVDEIDEGTIKVMRGGTFDEEQLDQMWSLFRTRFQDISENLPFRLEESEEATKELLVDPNNVFVFRTEADGKITCVLFGSDNEEDYPWINPAFLEKIDRKDGGVRPKTTAIFIPGVAAYKMQGIKAAPAVLDKMTDLAIATGSDHLKFRFECTDISSIYIPHLSEESIGRNDDYDSKTIATRLLGEKKYALIKV